MKLEFTDQPTPGVTLAEIVNGYSTEYRPPGEELPATFIYDGWVYALVKNQSASGLTVSVPHGFVAAMNLKSQTVRALRLTEHVIPVSATVQIVAKRTQRYLHG